MSELLAECQRLVTALAEATSRCAAVEQVEVTATSAHAADKASWTARLSEAEGAVAHAWQRTLDLELERERAAGELEAAARRHGGDRQELSRAVEAARRAEAARAATAAEVERLRAAVGAAQATLAAAQEEIRRAQGECEQLVAAGEAARIDVEDVRAELDGVRRSERDTRSELEGAMARITADLREARRQGQDAERARTVAAADVDSLTSNLLNTRTALQTAEDETRRTAADLDRLRIAEQAARAEGGELRRELQDAKLRATKVENELVALRTELATLRAAVQAA